ncbi:hypothetical protein [Pontibacter vulgaris]|uniref:hypothetical protein n=1 Tax=Pontibacter vulgaris TaxID=2905679 RepID=UPI001FA7AC24|nr:hypothetical protein [Pontibacter vulgaris]
MSLTRWALFLLGCMLLASCADADFFQKDALVKQPQPAGTDSVWVVAGRHYDRSAFHRFFWGDHNRDIWTTPVAVPVFNLHTTQVGFKLIEKGGGFQTISFELQDKFGRTYALRSIDKDPVQVLSKFWQPTFVTNIVRDQTSAANPYAALVVPVLAEAAGVLHTNPRLYYIRSTDQSFGQYAALVQGKLFLLEEKYKSPADLQDGLHNVIDIEGSEDALRLRFTNPRYHFDQKAFARARLLDLFLGDWDRHKGQWDWAYIKQDSEVYFKPIPKDRDQAFLKMNDGVIPFIATSKLLARKLHSFSKNIDDVKALMINAAFIDARLLNELTRNDWQQIAKQLQLALTDAVIEKSVRLLPAPIYTLIGKEITQSLKNRRKQLPAAADEMYKLLAAEVTIAGTDLKENFIVKRLPNGNTEVTMLRPATTKLPAKVMYQRVFLPHETNEIILHGLAGNDEFSVDGDVQDAILVKIYGGLGEDKITDNSHVAGRKKMTQIYDTERGNEILFGTEAKDFTTRDVRVHAYDREGN